MKASEVVDRLLGLIGSHGDFPVTGYGGSEIIEIYSDVNSEGSTITIEFADD